MAHTYLRPFALAVECTNFLGATGPCTQESSIISFCDFTIGFGNRFRSARTWCIRVFLRWQVRQLSDELGRGVQVMVAI